MLGFAAPDASYWPESAVAGSQLGGSFRGDKSTSTAHIAHNCAVGLGHIGDIGWAAALGEHEQRDWPHESPPGYGEFPGDLEQRICRARTGINRDFDVSS
jgi:hypothetical protein